MRAIENLVFKGGGVLGIAYAGAIEALGENNILPGVKRVAGTSAGSVVAALVSLKYTTAEIKKVMNDTNFKDFEDHWNPLRIATHYGLYKGEFLLTWIKGLIKEKTGNGESTFAELHAAGYLDLKVYSTDLTESALKEFSYETTPNVVVAESIRASMSIPLFFSAWQFPNSIPNDNIYVDGGVIYNYPISAFPDMDKTLGFFLTEEANHKPLKFDQLLSYTERLFSSIMQAQTIDFMENDEQKKDTVFVSSLGISSTNFKITDEEKTNLFNEGKKATLAYIGASVPA